MANAVQKPYKVQRIPISGPANKYNLSPIPVIRKNDKIYLLKIQQLEFLN
jgi:hypothetical protein